MQNIGKKNVFELTEFKNTKGKARNLNTGRNLGDNSQLAQSIDEKMN